MDATLSGDISKHQVFFHAPPQKPSTTKIRIHEEDNFLSVELGPISDVQRTKGEEPQIG